jgi:hypothetical protein
MGGGGEATNVNKFEPPSWVTGGTGGLHGWDDYVKRGGQIADIFATDPSKIYGNRGEPMVAQMSDLQNKAANGAYGLASSVPMLQQQQQQLQAFLAMENQLNGPTVNAVANKYAGDNPYLQSVIDSSNADITNNFARGTAAQTDAAAARSGAFGGSAHSEMTQANAKTLADSLGSNTSNIRMQNYNNSAGLEESYLGRSQAAQEAGLQRQAQALGLNQNQMQMLSGLWGQVMGAGDLQRQVQTENIAASKELHNANVQAPINALDLYGSILQRASGQGGTNTYTQPGQNPLMSILGGGLAGYGLLS